METAQSCCRFVRRSVFLVAFVLGCCKCLATLKSHLTTMMQQLHPTATCCEGVGGWGSPSSEGRFLSVPSVISSHAAWLSTSTNGSSELREVKKLRRPAAVKWVPQVCRAHTHLAMLLLSAVHTPTHPTYAQQPLIRPIKPQHLSFTHQQAAFLEFFLLCFFHGSCPVIVQLSVSVHAFTPCSSLLSCVWTHVRF